MTGSEKEAVTGITRISVAGFKSIRDKISIDIRPLTILAGANSSGKSSFMQPLLMLKQTLEASYDPGPLLLQGPHVNFSEVKQFLTKSDTSAKKQFSVGLKVGEEQEKTQFYSYTDQEGLQIEKLVVEEKAKTGGHDIHLNMSQKEIVDVLFHKRGGFEELLIKECILKIARERCSFIVEGIQKDSLGISVKENLFASPEKSIQSIIHLPGLRGNPHRDYPMTAVSDRFRGAFNDYMASVIYHWQQAEDTKRQDLLNAWLTELGLTWKVEARRWTDARLEIWIGCLSSPDNDRDMVNIVDVGFGVSQVLPILLALLVAKPGQMVYLEQPELHLHPRAQVALAGILSQAANRGVIVVVETHSELLLRSIQTRVAAGSLDRTRVKLHWFERDLDEGITRVTSTDLNEKGAFDVEWPEDFSSVAMESGRAFLEAVTKGGSFE